MLFVYLLKNPCNIKIYNKAHVYRATTNICVVYANNKQISYDFFYKSFVFFFLHLCQENRQGRVDLLHFLLFRCCSDWNLFTIFLVGNIKHKCKWFELTFICFAHESVRKVWKKVSNLLSEWCEQMAINGRVYHRRKNSLSFLLKKKKNK